VKTSNHGRGPLLLNLLVIVLGPSFRSFRARVATADSHLRYSYPVYVHGGTLILIKWMQGPARPGEELRVEWELVSQFRQSCVSKYIPVFIYHSTINFMCTLLCGPWSRILSLSQASLRPASNSTAWFYALMILPLNHSPTD
jgi:hypothetical protein